MACHYNVKNINILQAMVFKFGNEEILRQAYKYKNDLT
jgi:hypothetical protein